MGTFRVRNLLQTSLLMIASLAFALVAAEMTLRMTGLVPGRGGVVTVTAAEFERIPGMFGPNQDAVVNQIPQLRYQVRINNLGYRGADMPLEKPDGEYRILFVGDSFVFGDFVGNTETLPAQTEMVLRSQCNGMLRVINAGLGGSTITEHAKMIERSLRLEPDLVVLQFSENDVRDLAGSAMWDDLARNRHAKSAFPLSLVYPYLRNTALWNLALRAAATIHERSVTARVSENDGRENENARPQAETAPPDRKSPDESYRKQYRNLLTGLQSALRANDVPMMMAVMPSHLSVYDQWESDQLDWLEGLTRELGIDAVSFLPAFRDDGRNETELYLLPDDGHTSPAGYRLAARLLAERLIAYGRLSDHCGS